MEIRHLRYFVAVARELNFTRAAQSLHMSTPPLSQRIRSLESELGVALFDRSTHHTVLTTAGRELLPLARQLVAEFDTLPARVRRPSPGLEVRLTIPDVLSQAQRRHVSDVITDLSGRFTISLRQSPSVAMEVELIDSTTDLALCHMPTNHPQLVDRLLWSSELDAVVDSRRFPDLADITTAELRDLSFLRGPRSWDLRSNQHFSELRNRGVQIEPNARYSDVSGMLLLLRHAPLFALIPRDSEMRAAIDSDEFTVLPISDLSMVITTSCIRRSGDVHLDPLIDALAGSLDP